MEISQDLLDGVQTFGEFGRAWLDALPSVLDRLVTQWDLTIERAGPAGTCSYIALVSTRAGERAVVKVPIPHEEAAQEPAALRAWEGDGAVRLLDVDVSGAMLLELAEPGTPLARLDDYELAARIAGALLHRLHRPPPAAHAFRLLPDALAEWAYLARSRVRLLGSRDDYRFVDEGADLLETLPREAGGNVLLHGDYHHWNVIAATRDPWLAIDPKPMIGERAFDGAQFAGNHFGFVRNRDTFVEHVRLFADAAQVDWRRVLVYARAKTAEDAMWELSIGRPDDARDTLAYGRFLQEIIR